MVLMTGLILFLLRPAFLTCSMFSDVLLLLVGESLALALSSKLFCDLLNSLCLGGICEKMQAGL